MKVRYGYVSNSSSSSFVVFNEFKQSTSIYGNITEIEAHKLGVCFSLNKKKYDIEVNDIEYLSSENLLKAILKYLREERIKKFKKILLL